MGGSCLLGKARLSYRLKSATQMSHGNAELICYQDLALFSRRAAGYEWLPSLISPNYWARLSPIYWARLLMTKTRRFLTQFAKSQKQRNTPANYAFKKSIRIRSASRPFQAYVFIRCSLKTHHFITATRTHAHTNTLTKAVTVFVIDIGWSIIPCVLVYCYVSAFS